MADSSSSTSGTVTPTKDHAMSSQEVPAPANTTTTTTSQPPPSPLPPDQADGDPEKKAGAPPAYSAFSPWRKRFILIVVTVAGCFGPLAGNIYLPALPVLESEFHASATAINVTVSVFMLTFAFGPLFWASFADWKGRRPLYIISLSIYIVANILLAAVPANYGALVFLRIVQAFGSAAVVSMGAGTVADVTPPKERAFAMSIFLLGPQLGPVLGPVIGGALTVASWRWIFGFLAIAGFVLWIIILLMLPETLRARVGSGKLYSQASFILFPPKLSSPLAPESERGPPPPKPTLLMYWRLFSYPPIGIVSFNTAMLYSTYFAIAVQLPTELADRYNWSSAGVGAGFLAVGIAMIAGSLIGGRFSDWRRARAVKASPDNTVDPENRLADQIWGVIVCAGGCAMYGWFVDISLHPAAVLVATFLTGFGMNWVFVATTAFLTECVAQQAAGAFALGNMLRNPGAAIAALVIPSLVSKMGSGWCFTGLALLDLVLVGSAVIVLRIKSPGWRAARKAKMAAMAAAKPSGPR
ncbi:major facilitator superfamily transporter [Colletotrichum godetiae]|uniref:Major facilitator superfamily transporter n=1 Tax=Colletotrichum godetiae TaxID=1209918 RepID=A0AAJ0APS0_9PEZI|nr:major facilitator superfamily transporter [Colletotrichum godetiae]KAK1688132.1 major facilitator superfamily transporter [Colletotrichum godetiae]